MKEYLDKSYLIEDEFDIEEEEIDVMKYVLKVVKKWKTILRWGCCGIVVGLIFALSVVKSYTASTILIPEESPKSSNGIGSLAAMAGVNLGSLSSSDVMSPELYPQIVTSVPFKVELLQIQVSFKDSRDSLVSTDLYTYLDKIQKGAWYGYLINAPKMAYSWLYNTITGKDDEDKGRVVSDINPERLTNHQNMIVSSISEIVNVSVDKKTSLISVSVKLGDPEVAKQVCDQVIIKLQDYIVRYRTEKARKDLDYYQMLNDQARVDYYEAQNKFARYVDMNQGITLNSFLVERERLQNESNMAFQLFNQTAQQLQLAQAKIQMDTPVCVVLEPTRVPLRGEPKRTHVIAIWVVLFCIISSLFVMFEDMITEIKNRFRNEIDN